MNRKTRLRLRNRLLVGATITAVIAVNYQHVVSTVTEGATMITEAQPGYQRVNGKWTTITLPTKFRVNGIHSVMLATGKVLIVAGSGNNAQHFAAGTFDTLLWDPTNDTYQKIPTPADLFCGGHAFLPDGNVLIAGGTKKYEVLKDKVTNAAGVLTLVNDTDDADLMVNTGDLFTDQTTGLQYRATEMTMLPARTDHPHGVPTPSRTKIWVEAVQRGSNYVFTDQGHQFGWNGHDQAGLYGLADTITLEKQEYRGLNSSYIFDIRAEKYVKVGSMNTARWYPSLFSVQNGDVMAVSGLDQFGEFIDNGMGTTEEYLLSSKTWKARPDLERAFPTYPALFRGATANTILYTGANAGYGPADQMRTPGIWNLTNNTFVPISGLRDPQMNETAGSVLLPPAQNQDALFVGGGNVGEASGSTARVDVIHFSQKSISAAPSLIQPVRYPSVVDLPTDQVLITGGSSDYRGRHDSDVHAAYLYTPEFNSMTSVAPPHIGRDYHSEALLLPDGSVLTLGSDPLYGDKDDTMAGMFEQRFEVYRPPYFFTPGVRPTIEQAPSVWQRGQQISVTASGQIASARLIRPSAVTHMTDNEQRSVAVSVAQDGSQVTLGLDKNPNLTPSGWYMLFLVDANGKPSVARWIRVP